MPRSSSLASVICYEYVDEWVEEGTDGCMCVFIYTCTLNHGSMYDRGCCNATSFWMQSSAVTGTIMQCSPVVPLSLACSALFSIQIVSHRRTNFRIEVTSDGQQSSSGGSRSSSSSNSDNWNTNISDRNDKWNTHRIWQPNQTNTPTIGSPGLILLLMHLSCFWWMRYWPIKRKELKTNNSMQSSPPQPQCKKETVLNESGFKVEWSIEDLFDMSIAETPSHDVILYGDVNNKTMKSRRDVPLWKLVFAESCQRLSSW